MATTTLLPQDAQSLATQAGGGGPASVVDAYIKMISDGIDLVNKISSSLSQDARTIVVEVANFTSRVITQKEANFAHGGLGQTFPAEIINPFSTDVYSVSSDGLATGVQGSVTYDAEGAPGGDFAVDFDNPFVGSNSMDVRSIDVINSQIAIIGQISVSNHAHARFSIFDRSDPFPNRQIGWRSCSKCQAMFFGTGGGGACPTGGRHQVGSSFNYFSIFGARANSKLQGSWSSCDKCQCLHFSGFQGAPGVCASGGVHQDSQSFNYSVLLNCDPSAGRQIGWASCGKCRSLFFRASGGSCPAGGSHDASGSFGYGVDFTTT
jgi:hypothetical protein